MKFHKYQGLGNDYIVVEPGDLNQYDVAKLSKLICHRNYGVGSDGLLLGPYNSDAANCKLRIINPDGSEAEKSGNGLRIFSRYLWDTQQVGDEAFTIETSGGIVRSQILHNGELVKVEMGRVSFNSDEIGLSGPAREVINENLEIDGNSFLFCGVTVGNPHCVILNAKVDKAEICRFGPLIENEKRFINRTNVQFLKVLNRHSIQIQIWERGAGYTLASGSSATATAAVAYKLGFCDKDITVEMPGGNLNIEFTENMDATMTGPAVKIADGSISQECLASL